MRGREVFKFGFVGDSFDGHPERRAKPEVEGSQSTLVAWTKRVGDPSTPRHFVRAPLRMTAHKRAKERPITSNEKSPDIPSGDNHYGKINSYAASPHPP